MKELYLTGENIFFRAIEKGDTEELALILNEENIRIYGDDDTPYPMSCEKVEKFDQGNKSGNNFIICKNIDKKIIGTIAIYSVSYQHLTCEVGITISEKYQGKGYGREAMNIIINFIFMYLSINKIKLQVSSFHSTAIKLYENLGFKHEGTFKEEIFRFAQFQDIENYALLRKDWMK